MDKKSVKSESSSVPFFTEGSKEPKPLNILILEDDKLTVKIIEDILEGSGKACSVSVARHGSAALDLIKDTQFDMAFIDIWLPDMNGLDILARIKELHPHTVCHVISSQSDNSYVNRARMLGVEQYILKPFTEDQILDIIHGFEVRSSSGTA